MYPPLWVSRWHYDRGSGTTKYSSTIENGSLVSLCAIVPVDTRLRYENEFYDKLGRNGFLLVLGTGNVDEALRGYMTKYDCSSADINPIGGISKGDLSRMLLYVSEKYQIPSLRYIAEATPTVCNIFTRCKIIWKAELRPVVGSAVIEGHSQADEVEMGMTYRELGVFGYFQL